jgi:hypothetical protein
MLVRVESHTADYVKGTGTHGGILSRTHSMASNPGPG